LAQALEGRKEKVAAVCATVERDLECVGASAVEDQLQDEV
jgi:magnesium-transporting ATPase (P-type)